MYDEALKVWRLRKTGHTVVGYRGAAFHYVDSRDIAYRKMNAICSMLGETRASRFLEVPRATAVLDDGIAFIQRAGSALRPNCMQDLARLAVALRTLHETDIPSVVPEVLNNDLLAADCYDPDAVWAAFYQPPLSRCNAVVAEVATSIFQTLAGDFRRGMRATGLIHGDVHPLNALVFDDDVKLIDWSDARRDVPLVDLSQFVLSAGLDAEHACYFLESYEPTLELEDIMLFIFLNILWAALYMPSNAVHRAGALKWCAAITDFHPLRPLFPEAV